MAHSHIIIFHRKTDNLDSILSELKNNSIQYDGYNVLHLNSSSHIACHSNEIDGFITQDGIFISKDSIALNHIGTDTNYASSLFDSVFNLCYSMARKNGILISDVSLHL